MVIKYPKELLLIIIVASSLLFPNIFLPGGTVLKFNWVLLLGFSPLIISSFFYDKYNDKAFCFIFSLLLVTHITSLLLGYISAVPFCGLDLILILDYARYLILVALCVLVNPNIFLGYFDKLIKYGSVFLIVICFIEYFNFKGFANILGSYYSSELHINNMLEEGRRIVATGGDPNVGAAIISYFCIYLFISFFKNKNLIDIIKVLLLFTCLIFTSSRTIFIGTLCSLLLYLIFIDRLQLKYKLIIIGVFGLIIIILLPYFYYLFFGINSLFSDTGNSSLNTRYEMWVEAYKLIKQSPFWGWGPAIAILDPVVDGDYFYMTRTFGIMGISIYFGIIVFAIRSIFNRCKCLDCIFYQYKYYVLLIFILSLFIMFTNSFYMGTQLFIPFISLVTVLYKCHPIKVNEDA